MSESIKKYAFKDGHKLEFEILDIAHILAQKKEMMTVPHRAQFHHILWLEKGKGTHYVDFNPITLRDNTIIFIPHNSVNIFDTNNTYKGKVLIFTDAFFCKNNLDLRFLHSSILFSDLYDIANFNICPQSSELRVSLNSMQTEYLREHDSAQYQILHNMLHIFILHAEREMRKQGFKEIKPSQNLNDLVSFKDVLETNFRQERAVKHYASQLGLSEKQLHKVTTSLLEKTPKQIIDERVLLEAKRLLSHSTQSIKEIAYELGYEEPTNFIKYFRKHTSTTPSEFRAQF